MKLTVITVLYWITDQRVKCLGEIDRRPVLAMIGEEIAPVAHQESDKGNGWDIRLEEED